MRKLLLSILILIMIISIGGCSKKKDVFIYESTDQDWSIEIPNRFKMDSEEATEDFNFTSYRSENGENFSITEIADKDTLVDEESLKADLGEDSYLHITRNEVLDVEKVGKIYGALIEDHAVNGHMLYYKLRINDRIVNLLFYKKQQFTLEEEGKIKGMVGSIKKLK